AALPISGPTQRPALAASTPPAARFSRPRNYQPRAQPGPVSCVAAQPPVPSARNRDQRVHAERVVARKRAKELPLPRAEVELPGSDRSRLRRPEVELDDGTTDALDQKA